jgi:hypothetical protein
MIDSKCEHYTSGLVRLAVYASLQLIRYIDEVTELKLIQEFDPDEVSFLAFDGIDKVHVLQNEEESNDIQSDEVASIGSDDVRYGTFEAVQIFDIGFHRVDGVSLERNLIPFYLRSS